MILPILSPCVYNFIVYDITQLELAMPYAEMILKTLPFIREFGIRTDPTGAPLPFHRNDGFEIVYILSGHYRWELANGRILDVRGRQLSMTLPSIPHRGYLDHQNPGRLVFIVFDPADPSFCSFTHLTAADSSHMQDKLFNFGNGTYAGSRELDAAATSLNSLLTTELRPGFAALDQAVLCSSTILFLLTAIQTILQNTYEEEENPISRLIEYIENHLDEPLTLARLELIAGWSRTRLYTLFNRYLGQSPNDYIQSLRCDRARKLLEERDVTATEIAYELGFSSSQYFSRVFRKYTGLSPVEYRRRVHGH